MSAVAMRLGCLWLAVAAGLAAPSVASEPPKVLSTTTMLQSAIREVAGARRTGKVLIPGGSCPGHYDLRSGDIAALQGGSVLFCHGYEGFLPRLEASAAGRSFRIVRIPASESWLVPEGYNKGLKGVCDALCRLDPARGAQYRVSAARAMSSCSRTGRALRDTVRRSGLTGRKVVCSEQLAPFVRWLGLHVVATFGRADDLSPKGYQDLCRRARKNDVRVVIDNLQSAGVGRSLAAAVNARCVVLSNFPGALPATPDWSSTVRANVRLLVAAFGRTGR